MSLRRLLIATLIAAASVVAVPSTPAWAFEGEPIVIDAKEGAAVSVDYGPMPAPDTGGVFSHPGDCATAPSCTEIPLTVNLPAEFDPSFNEFFFNFLVEWQGNVDLVAAGSQDLDIYIYTLRPNPETGEEEYVVVGQAATADSPERTRLFNLTEGEYVICVQNFTGVNLGFRISMDFVDATIDPNFDPFEGTNVDDVRPGGSSGASGSGGDSADDGASLPSSSSGGFFSLDPTELAPTSPASLSPSAPTDAFGFGLSATPGDSGLGEFGSFNEFQKELNAEAAPSSIDLLAASRRKLGPASDVGPPVLIFWLFVVPLALAGVFLVILMRRRPVALTLSA